VWDEQEEPSFAVEDVKDHDSIFVSWHVSRFLDEVAPQISVPFFLVTSNSDYSVTEADVAKFRKTRGLHWWAANLLVPVDAQLTAIPLGLQNEAACWYGDVSDFVRLRQRSEPRKLPLVCWGFAVQNAPLVRGPIRDALKRNPWATEVANLDPYLYRRELRKYRYVASPPGNGPDTHRTWEALSLGVTPLLLETQLTKNFRAQGQLQGAEILKSVEDFANFDPRQVVKS
jgi:hypothetical protein